ncbi:hypothetical protein WA158_001227 [Blastocystis sp. Blastoise]
MISITRFNKLLYSMTSLGSRSLSELYSYKDKADIMSWKKMYSEKENIQKNIKEITSKLGTNSYYLGFDLSSHSTGYTILDSKDHLVEYGLLTPEKSIYGDSLEIADYYTHQIKDLKKKYNKVKWVISIEMFMKTYNVGMFQTKNLFLLADINAIVTYNCWHLFKSKPILVHPSSARSVLGIKAAGDRSKTKLSVIQYVQLREPSMCLPIDRKTDFDSSSDIADSYIIALYGKWKTIYNMYMNNQKYIDQFKKSYIYKYEPLLDRQLKTFISMHFLENNIMF